MPRSLHCAANILLQTFLNSPRKSLGCAGISKLLDYSSSLLKALQGPCTFQKLPKI